MLLVDQNKAVIVGKLDTVVKELAFLVDKLSEQRNEQGDISSEKVMDLFYEEVAGFQKDRERGVSRDHPHDEGDSNSRDSGSRGNKKERATAAEAALIEAMKEIQEMRADKEKALKKKKNKKNKKEK